MDILNNFSTVYGENYATFRFMSVIDDHYKYIRDNSTKTIEINENTVTKWAGDFYGLLASIGVKPDIHYIVLRINDLRCPNDDFSHLERILLPSESSIETIRSKFN